MAQLSDPCSGVSVLDQSRLKHVAVFYLLNKMGQTVRPLRRDSEGSHVMMYRHSDWLANAQGVDSTSYNRALNAVLAQN